MRFSIILNSRKRPKLLSNLLDSLLKNTNNIKDIEVFISCDNDDDLTKDWLFNESKWYYFCNFEFIERDRNLVRRFNNLVKNNCNGEYIWNLNDDTEIITPNWDIISYDILNSFHKDGIKYGCTQCTSLDRNGEYASFPIHSKKGIDILGYYMNESFPGLGGDVHLWRVYNSINRVIDIPILVRHVLHETLSQIINCDQTAYEMREKTKSGENCWKLDISEDINKLQNYINEQVISSI